MDKKDVMYIAAALVLVLVIALVIKPLVTGHPVETGIPVPTTQEVTIIQTMSPGAYIQSHMTTAPPTPTPSPTSPPPWNPAESQVVGFVDPSAYGLSTNQSSLNATRVVAAGLDTNMTTFATIESSTGRSGTTKILYIPFPYWELVYTVEPASDVKPVTIKLTPTKGEGLSYSGVSGSYSTAKPQFTIQVMDGNDPNRIVRTITPPGGIDLNLWKGIKPSTTHENSQFKTNQMVTAVETKIVDPRPWTEKFFEGQRNYYFIITAQSLDSYSIEIQIPTRYLIYPAN